MNKKNKLIILIIALIILVIAFKRIFVFESINYSLNIDGNKIKIKEKYEDNYYIEINTGKNIYPFRIYNNFNNKRKIINKIYLYNDKYIECMLPVIENNIYTDFMCSKDGIIYDYNNIKGEIPKLDKYVETINEYNEKNFNSEPDSLIKIGSTKYNIYKNLKDISVITTYNGLIVNGSKINIFKKDIYNNKISAFLDKYYIVADYENEFTFDHFYIINIITKDINKLKLKEPISYDSYIQGIVDNKIYLYDKDSQNQYEIDIENNGVNIVSSVDYIKYYNNKKWEKLNKIKANKEVYFNYNTLENNFSNYDYVKESDNYYYLFKKEGISYKLYRVDKNNINIYKYILNIPVTNIYLNKDAVYYIYKDKLYYYRDSIGLKIIYENPELEFNNTIKYYIY